MRTRRPKKNRTWTIDDRTGRKVKHKRVKKEWNGLWVTPDEWEAKHPALKPTRVVGPEPTVFKGTRPDIDLIGVTVDMDSGGRSGVTSYYAMGLVSPIVIYDYELVSEAATIFFDYDLITVTATEFIDRGDLT